MARHALFHLQAGKTTAVLAGAESWPGPTRFAAADRLPTPGTEWIENQWALARRDAGDDPPADLGQSKSAGLGP